MSSRSIQLGCNPAEIADVRIVEAACGSARDVVVERLVDKAQANGFAEGVNAANVTSAQALSEAAAQLDAYREEAMGSVVRTSVELAIEIARHLICVEVESGRHDVERIVREALAASGTGRGECVVHLHPDDTATLAGVQFRAGTRLEPDVGVARGEVQIETQSGVLVRDLKDALQSIGERILASLR